MFGTFSLDVLIVVSFIIMIFIIIYISDSLYKFKHNSRVIALTGLSVIVFIMSLTCRFYGWNDFQEVDDYEEQHDIISLSSDDNYQMNLSSSSAFSIGYISGSANKLAKYVVFENRGGKYIRKEYAANKTFIKFSKDETPHVTIEHKKSIAKAKTLLLEDRENDFGERDEVTIVVPENTHQSKFNVE